MYIDLKKCQPEKLLFSKKCRTQQDRITVNKSVEKLLEYCWIAVGNFGVEICYQILHRIAHKLKVLFLSLKKQLLTQFTGYNNNRIYIIVYRLFIYYIPSSVRIPVQIPAKICYGSSN